MLKTDKESKEKKTDDCLLPLFIIAIESICLFFENDLVQLKTTVTRNQIYSSSFFYIMIIVKFVKIQTKNKNIKNKTKTFLFTFLVNSNQT